MMKSHSSKETRVPENKSLPRLLQDEMIVFLRVETGWFRPQFAAHPEMDPNPISAGEFKEHLFPSRKGTQKTAASELLHDAPRFSPAKNPFPGMELHRRDFLAEAGVPLLAKIFDLSEFRHRAK
jgi:hypothetical protein